MKTILAVVAAVTALLSGPALAHGGLVDLSVYDPRPFPGFVPDPP